MTTVTESRRKAGGGRRGDSSHTQLLLTQGCHSPLLSLLRDPTEPPGGWGSPWPSYVLACSLSFMHIASSVVSSLLPALVGTSVAPGSPQNPPRWQPPHSSQGNLLSRGRPGSKHLCFFWNQTPGTRFFLQQHFPQFTKCRASQVLCHQPAHSVQASLSQARD